MSIPFKHAKLISLQNKDISVVGLTFSFWGMVEHGRGENHVRAVWRSPVVLGRTLLNTMHVENSRQTIGVQFPARLPAGRLISHGFTNEIKYVNEYLSIGFMWL